MLDRGENGYCCRALRRGATTPALAEVSEAVSALGLLLPSSGPGDQAKPHRLNADERQLIFLNGDLQPKNESGRLARVRAFSRLLDQLLDKNIKPGDVLPIYETLIEPLIASSATTESLAVVDRKRWPVFMRRKEN